MLHGLEAMAGALLRQRVSPAQVAAIAAKHRRMLECHNSGKRLEYFRLNQQIHQMIVDAAANPVLSNVYATLMAKVHRARGAANADMLRWSVSMDEHEAILATLEDPAHADLPEILRTNSENTAREVLAVLNRTRANTASAGDALMPEASGEPEEVAGSDQA